jgi:hypothetical protein
MIPITVIIPSRFNVEGLFYLAPNLDDADGVFILDNGLPPNSLPILQKAYNNLEIVPCHGLSIYEMWNLGQDITIKKFGENYTAILNDDIRIDKNTLSKLATALELDEAIGAISPDYGKIVDVPPYIEYVTSTFGHGGLAGFAFMIRSSLMVRVDTNFKWWYGDDDLVKQIEAMGKRVAILRSVPVDHSPGTSSKILGGLDGLIAQDRLYFNNKYGESR